MNEESLYWLWLYNIEGIGLKGRKKLIEHYGSPKKAFFEINRNDVIELGISSRSLDNIMNGRDLELMKRRYEQLREKQIEVVTLADVEYPQRLKNIYDPPGVLYVRGKLPREDRVSIAIVGARECTNYGKELATYFAKELSNVGVQIISGLARGIDRYAHEGAVNLQNGTFAVLGCGIDQCYPRENISLYMNMLKTGGIISEYPPGYRPLKGNFPMRNRIISGLCDGILLVEAREKSGSLITMDWGLEQGKNIYACPGRVFDSLSYGTNHIIQMGGKLVMEPKDILEDYEIQIHDIGKKMKKNKYMLEKEEKIVYDGLSLMPKHMEEIMLETGMTVEQVSSAVLSLQLKGIIKQIAGNYFSRTVRTEEKE